VAAPASAAFSPGERLEHPLVAMAAATAAAGMVRFLRFMAEKI
jgi:hypothetical protein